MLKILFPPQTPKTSRSHCDHMQVKIGSWLLPLANTCVNPQVTIESINPVSKICPRERQAQYHGKTMYNISGKMLKTSSHLALLFPRCEALHNWPVGSSTTCLSLSCVSDLRCCLEIQGWVCSGLLRV